jgi:arylsulfatase A-like enzyme
MRRFPKRATMARRHLGALGFVLLAVTCLACGKRGTEKHPDAAPPDRPNILFLFTDDQRADAVGAYGNPYVRTPTVDALARRGFSFREAHIMGSHHGAVCAPSRAMLMSGRTLFHVYDDLDSVETFPEVLGRNGYVTFGTGKWHQSRESFARSFQHGRNVFFGGMSDHEAVPLQHRLPDGGFSEVEVAGFSTDLFVDAAISWRATRPPTRRHRSWPTWPSPPPTIPVPRPRSTGRCTLGPDNRFRPTSCRCTPSTTGG